DSKRARNGKPVTNAPSSPLEIGEGERIENLPGSDRSDRTGREGRRGGRFRLVGAKVPERGLGLQSNARVRIVLQGWKNGPRRSGIHAQLHQGANTRRAHG